MAAREAGKRRTRLTLPVPAEAVVDPRLGARGPALMALEDGTVFPGIAFGAAVAAGGDLVANTSQTGYQEVCTDPSYAGQVVVMTYPLIGNYGRLEGDDQSARPWLRALVVAHATAGVMGRARQLAHLLRENGVPAIAGVDTRAVARRLRETGAQRAIVTAPGEVDPDAAVAAARARAALGGPGLRGGRLGPRPVRGAAGGSGRRWAGSARGRGRLRPQAQHRGRAGGAGRARPGHAPHLDGGAGPDR